MSETIKGNPFRQATIFRQWLKGYSTISDEKLADYAKSYKLMYFTNKQ